jgi:hypothetical protein
LEIVQFLNIIAEIHITITSGKEDLKGEPDRRNQEECQNDHTPARNDRRRQHSCGKHDLSQRREFGF